MKPEYAPRHRFVAEVTKPRLAAMYMDGVPIDPALLDAHISTDHRGFNVIVTMDRIQVVTGQKYHVGPANDDIEVVFIDD